MYGIEVNLQLSCVTNQFTLTNLVWSVRSLIEARNLWCMGKLAQCPLYKNILIGGGPNQSN